MYEVMSCWLSPFYADDARRTCRKILDWRRHTLPRDARAVVDALRVLFSCFVGGRARPIGGHARPRRFEAARVARAWSGTILEKDRRPTRRRPRRGRGCSRRPM